MECNTNFFDSWLKEQEKIINKLSKMTEKKHSDSTASTERESETRANDFYSHKYIQMKEMLQAVKKSSAANSKVVDECLSKALNGSKLYSQLHAIWKPLNETALNNSGDDRASAASADPLEYKKILDRIFGIPAIQLTDILAQWEKYAESFHDPSQDFIQPWIHAGKIYFGNFPNFNSDDSVKTQEFLQNMLTAFSETCEAFFPQSLMHSFHDHVAQSTKGMECLATYLLATSKYQHMIYVSGERAMEKVVSEVSDRIAAGEESCSFKDFFDQWIQVNESSFRDLFGTDDFSKIRNEMLGAYLRLRTQISRQIELSLAEYPIPVRSEMDDLYKIIYELKKKVKILEKKVNEAGK